MAVDRYVLLGLAPPRAEWFRAVAHWCNTAAVPAEFVKCVSAAEVRAQAASGRVFSAVLVDAAASGLDRDLLDLAVPVLVVDDDASAHWLDLGAAAVVPRSMSPDALLSALASHAVRVGDATTGAVADVVRPPGSAAAPGRVVAVCGPGGTGASSVAVALAQGLGGSVLLADLCLRAQQAMLHDARTLGPGVEELTESFRSRRPAVEEVRSLTARVTERGYDLLLGLRQPRAWASLRPRAFEAAFDGLRTAWDVVVCDTDADVEGERECGSLDVEERNVMARTAMARADVVFVVGVPGMKGIHSLVRTVADLTAFGVAAGRIVCVLNRAPRSPRARADCARTLSSLADSPLRAPVFLPDRRVDDLLRDGVRLPPVLTAPLVAACSFDGPPPVAAAALEPQRITPGTLGAWSEG